MDTILSELKTSMSRPMAWTRKRHIYIVLLVLLLVLYTAWVSKWKAEELSGLTGDIKQQRQTVEEQRQRDIGPNDRDNPVVKYPEQNQCVELSPEELKAVIARKPLNIPVRFHEDFDLDIQKVPGLKGSVLITHNARHMSQPQSSLFKCDMADRGNYKVCNDRKYGVKPPCLVYSFGIHNKWDFDDAMGQLGCKVFAFDPSMGKRDFKRSENISFYALGIQAKDMDDWQPPWNYYFVHSKVFWKVRTLSSIMKMLGHEKSVLDVLKIDTDSSEYPAVREMLDKGIFRQVRQLVVEWHLFPNNPLEHELRGFLQTIRDLKKAGFEHFYSKCNSRAFREVCVPNWDRNTGLFCNNAYVNTKFQP